MSPSCNDVSGKELQPRRRRRTHVPDKPNYSLNLWSIMKNCIGKELSKIPMPVSVSVPRVTGGLTDLYVSCFLCRSAQVNFNEPLSMLQRLSEDLEYHELLDKAARCDSSLEQMCLVAAFSVSSYSTTVHRTAKPFNPLLGETYELDRLEEFGYRSLCEQVMAPPLLYTGCEGNKYTSETFLWAATEQTFSFLAVKYILALCVTHFPSIPVFHASLYFTFKVSHHPPAAAHHVISQRGWTLWQEITIASKFRGKYLSIMPLGEIRHHFTASDCAENPAAIRKHAYQGCSVQDK